MKTRLIISSASLILFLMGAYLGYQFQSSKSPESTKTPPYCINTDSNGYCYVGLTSKGKFNNDKLTLSGVDYSINTDSNFSSILENKPVRIFLTNRETPDQCVDIYFRNYLKVESNLTFSIYGRYNKDNFAIFDITACGDGSVESDNIIKHKQFFVTL